MQVREIEWMGREGYVYNIYPNLKPESRYEYLISTNRLIWSKQVVLERCERERKNMVPLRENGGEAKNFEKNVDMRFKENLSISMRN